MAPRRPHPYFWFVVAATVAGIVTAAVAGGRAPKLALYSNILYRVEVGALTMVVLYVVIYLLWLGWHGRAPKKLPLPGTPGLDTASETLDLAAADQEEFQEVIEERVGLLEDAVRDLAEEQLSDAKAGGHRTEEGANGVS